MPDSVEDLLTQANLELHEEVGKEVRINLENEAKIRRLEGQQARYEADIQYLYDIIKNLETQQEYDNKTIHSLRLQLSELQSRFEDSEKTCSEKEKFILFRESQLLELEDTIYRLNNTETTPSNSEMASSSGTRPPLESVSNTDLLEEIRNGAEQLYMYSARGVKLPNLEVAQNLRDRIVRASDIVHRRLANEVKELNTALHNCKEEGGRLRTVIEESNTRIHHLTESLLGAKAEIDGKDEEIKHETKWRDDEIDRLVMICDELDPQLRELTNQIEERDRRIGTLNEQLHELLNASEGLERNADRLLRGSEQLRINLEQANHGIAERDILINRYRNTLLMLRDERDVALARYMTERLETRSLTRQRLALRIANRQLQIRLMNPPVVIPPPIPQPPLPNISWLMLH